MRRGHGAPAPKRRELACEDRPFNARHVRLSSRSKHRQRSVTKQTSLLAIHLNCSGRESNGDSCRSPLHLCEAPLSSDTQAPSARFISLKYPSLLAHNFPGTVMAAVSLCPSRPAASFQLSGSHSPLPLPDCFFPPSIC